ncbi:MAG: hypothetical protein ACTHQ3_19280 [Motilibacteraceae bacterium]
MPLRSTLLPPAPRPSAAADRFDAWLAGLPARTGLQVLRPTARVPFDVVVLVPGGAAVRVAGRGRRLVVSLWAPASARAMLPVRDPEPPELTARGVRRVGLLAGPGTILDVHVPPTCQAAVELPLTEGGRPADPLGAATLGLRADPDELDAALARALGALLP